MNQPSQEKVGVAALERGLSILEAFTHACNPLSLAELSQLTGLYKSTILRLCASLLRRGFLHRLDDGRYHVGPAVFQLGRIYQRSFKLGDAVVPVLRHLVSKTGESASFYVRDGESDVCLYRIDSPHPIRDAGVAEGDRFPIDDSACSLMLSSLGGKPCPSPEMRAEDIVVATKQSRRIAGAAAVLSPVFQLEKRLAGVLLLSGPESRFTDAAIGEMTRLLLDQSAHLTQVLGGDARPFLRALAETAEA